MAFLVCMNTKANANKPKGKKKRKKKKKRLINKTNHNEKKKNNKQIEKKNKCCYRPTLSSSPRRHCSSGFNVPPS